MTGFPVCLAGGTCRYRPGWRPDAARHSRSRTRPRPAGASTRACPATAHGSHP
nr:MAG TPA: hypothetical protein [Caudoviricetes sp.]DAH86063.1 MAG TPA: hypothetical protein [Caudoviricetes sp.]